MESAGRDATVRFFCFVAGAWKWTWSSGIVAQDDFRDTGHSAEAVDQLKLYIIGTIDQPKSHAKKDKVSSGSYSKVAPSGGSTGESVWGYVAGVALVSVAIGVALLRRR